ncbi:MAG: hypothetical protein F2571_03300 [Actinobacteria bacterium]|uniref:Unannotated protein n=1 Tax=freshwater metagenome TaxID=449393 RepID=A0A6J6FP37_9ZZZZ|nr:hypothetical protein [Actinomycetota bacterium]
MSILNFEDKPGRGPKKPLKALLGIGGLAAVIALASTLAANININSGPIEFGQGVSQTSACDDQITVTPYSTFINDSSTGSHRLTSIKVSGIDSTQDHCAGKTFVIKAYDEEGKVNLFNYSQIDFSYPPIVLQSDTYTAVEITNYGGTFVWTSGGTDGDDVLNDENVGDPGRDLTQTSFTVNLVSASSTIVRTPLASAQDVEKITVETKNAVNASFDCSDVLVPNDAPSYYPCGPQLNVPISTLTAAGWTPCFEDNYDNDTRTVSDAYTNCTGNYLAVFGQEVSGSTALLLSVAPRNEVFTVTEGNRPHLANGTYWYYTPINDRWTYDPSGNGRSGDAQSLGFAPNAIINQSTCDYNQEIGDPTSPYRLCWHISNDPEDNVSEPTFVRGYRIGLIFDDEGGNYVSGNYLRVIYQHSGTNE